MIFLGEPLPMAAARFVEGASVVQAAILSFCSDVRPPSDLLGRIPLSRRRRRRCSGSPSRGLRIDLLATAEFATPCSERYVLLVRSTRPLSSGDLGGMTLIVFNPRYRLMTAPCTAAPSQAFAKVGDGNAISWLRYRSFRCFGDEPVQSSIGSPFWSAIVFSAAE